MKQTLAGIPTQRFYERDYYLAIACKMCGVTPLEVMSSGNRKSAVATARRAIIWKLYNDGGLTIETVGAMLGIKRNSAWSALKQAYYCLQLPHLYPLLTKVVIALNGQ